MRDSVLSRTVKTGVYRRLQNTLTGILRTLGLLVLLGAAQVASAQSVDWVLNLEDTGFDPVPAGATIAYQIAVSERDGKATGATTITLDVPAGASFTAQFGTITGCTPAPTAAGPVSVTCTVPALAPGGTADLTFQVQSTVNGTIVVNAALPLSAGSFTDSDAANNTATEPTTVNQGANLALTLNGPASAASGSRITYEYTVTNNGPDAVTAAELEFPVPSGLTAFSAPAGCTLGAGIYTCALGSTVAVSGTAVFSFDATVSAASGSTVTAAATVGNSTPSDPDTSDNSVTLDTSISAGTDLAISLVRAPSGALLVGDAAVFTISSSYTGDSPSAIEVQDVLPANYQIDSVVAPGWSCSTVGQQVTCTQASGTGAGAAVDLGDITINTTVIAPGAATNTATISSATAETNTANNTASDSAVIAVPGVDLRASKTGPSPALVVVGNTYSFTVNATNDGTADFFGTLELTDNIPAGMSVTGYSGSGWSCLPAASVGSPVVGPAPVTCSRVYTSGSPLAAGATTPNVSYDVTVSATGVLTNGVTVSSPDGNLPDGNAANDLASYTVTSSLGTGSADLRMLKSVAVDPVAAGEEQTFDLEIVNDGPQTALDVEVEDQLTRLINNSEGATGSGLISVTFTANSAVNMTCSSVANGGRDRLVSCDMDSLPVCTAGVDCPTVQIKARPGREGETRTNTAVAVSQTTPDPNLANNTGSATYTVLARADVTVEKDATPTTAIAGQNLTYVVTARNPFTGLSRADDVTVTDTLPLDVTFVSATPSEGSCSATPAAGATTTAGDRTVTCELGDINNGAQRTITIVVRPNFVTRGGTITNDAAVSTTTTETDLTNNTTSIATNVANPQVDLLVNKIDDVDPLSVGDTTTYTITLRNQGPSAAENVVMTDTLPASRLTYQSHVVPADGTCGTVPSVGSTGGALQCSFPLLAAGEERDITVVMEGSAKGVATNAVSVASDETGAGFETNPLNNAVDETTTVRTKADVEVVSKVPSSASVALEEDFNWVITLRNNTGAGLDEADSVEFSDTLPSGMRLTGPHVLNLVSGSVTGGACSSSAGDTSFACNFGTMSAGAEVTITLPVEVVSVPTAGISLTNTATVTTSSDDTDPTNNENSGSVTVNASSIAGFVFKDFGDDGAIDGADSGLAGVTVTLTGTTGDGASVSRTTTTDVFGAFSFGLLPAGDYAISHGTIAEAALTPGTANIPGTAGGTDASDTSITGIALPAATAATDYLFPKVPQSPAIQLVKSITGIADTNGSGLRDAGDVVSYSFTVTNTGTTQLNGVTIADPLVAVVGGPVDLAIGASDSATFTASYTLTAGDVTAGFVRNQATASGNAVDGAGNPVRDAGGAPITVTDLSDTGTDPQLAVVSNPGATETPDEAGTTDADPGNDPTVALIAPQPGIQLVKSITGIADTNGSGLRDAGDVVSYSFTVTNTGNTRLGDVTVTDPLVSVSGGPVTLELGGSDSSSFTASYTLTQADVDAGFVRNQATVEGKAIDGAGTPILSGGLPITVTDLSDTGTDPQLAVVTDPATTETPDEAGNTDADPGNDPTVALITPLADIELVKSITGIADTNGNGLRDAGDVVSYAFIVTNTGGTALGNVTVTDPLVAVVGGPVNLAIGASDTGSFTATYTLTQANVDAGFVRNQATTTGTALNGAGDPILDGGGAPVTVSDISDTGTDPQLADVTDPATTETPDEAGNTDADPTNDPTVALIAPAPGISLIKSLVAVEDTNGSGLTDAGDTLRYSFAVTNTGNVALGSVTVTDPLVTVSGGPVSLAIGATDASSFTASYVVTATDVTRGYVENTATTTGAAVDSGGTPILDGGNPITVTDTSDSGTDPDGDPVTDPETVETPDGSGGTDGDPANDPTVAPLAPAPVPGIQLVKSITGIADSNGNGLRDAGDVVSYAFTVTNTGNTALGNVTVTDPLVTVAGGPVALALGASDTTSFTATYTLTQANVDAGFVRNTATTTGTALTSTGDPILVGGVPLSVTDISDTGTDPQLAVVTNPGTTETPDEAGNTDADPGNDPTVALIAPQPGISLIKSLVSAVDTNANGVTDAGDTLRYRFIVTNTGNVALADVTVTDPLVTVAGGPVDLAVGARDSFSFTASYTLTTADMARRYVENTATTTGTAVDSSGTPILDGGTPIMVTDISDSGTDTRGAPVTDPEGTETPDGAGNTDGDPTNDPTVAPLDPVARISLIKLATLIDDTNGDGVLSAGDTVRYGFIVRNRGNVVLNNVTVTDNTATVSGGPITLAIGQTDRTSFTATYVLTNTDLTRGFVENTAIVTGTGDDGTPGGIPVIDISDAGTDLNRLPITDPEDTETPDGDGNNDGDPTNDPTVTGLTVTPKITLVKSITGIADTNGSGLRDAGDVVSYAFRVTNSGTARLGSVTVTDPLVTVSGGPVVLEIGETDATSFTASYTLTQADVDAGFVRNSATATGTAVNLSGDPILVGGVPQTTTDVSDTGTDPQLANVTAPGTTETPDEAGRVDGDPTNDPTVALITPEPGIALVKSADASGLTTPVRLGQQIVYRFTVTNIGNVTLRDVVVTDDLPGVVLTGGPIASLAPGQSDATTYSAVYTIQAGDLTRDRIVNQARVTGVLDDGGTVDDDSGGTNDDDDSTVTPITVLPTGYTLAKTAGVTTADVGSFVPYTITATSRAGNTATTVDIADVLPDGFIYREGSGQVNGTAREPAISGQTVRWVGLPLAPGGTITVTLQALVTDAAGPGRHDNRARLIDSATGADLAAEAVATVRILAEPVFDCGTVIGRVFDDINQDGAYNAGDRTGDHAAITDQTYATGKGGKTPEPVRETGLPGVRLVAPDGLTITTDQYGRFSVPCAALPSAIGSNFMLKLDERSLPAGFRLTTENPRVVRLTPGMVTKMNFGATVSRLVRIDLSDRAFLDGKTPRPELEAGLRQMVAQIADTPSMLRIAYAVGPEGERVAKARLQEVQRILRRIWPANGRYQLNVETVLERPARAVNE